MAIFFCAIQAENIDTFLKIKKKTFWPPKNCIMFLPYMYTCISHTKLSL
jgi:hypothetical protein